jgi:hypothetical protein
MSHLDPERIETIAHSREEDAHLAGCAECRGHVQRARARQQLLGAMKGYTLSDAAFRRVEARLEDAIAAGATQPSRAWLWWSLAGVAMVAALLVLLPGETTRTPWTVALPREQVAAAGAPFQPLTVLRASPGTQAHAGDQPWRPVSGGDVLAAGQALASASLLAAPEGDAAWALEAQGALSLGGAASVTLGAGELVAQVKSPIEVLASSRRVLAQDALFALSRTGAEVVLHVARGEVTVVDTLTAERRVVQAPLALRWGDGSTLAEGREEPLRSLDAPAVPAKPWTRFDATGLKPGTEVSLDGRRVGVAPFVELVSGGRRRLGLTPPGEALRESWAQLVGGQPYDVRADVPLTEPEEREPDAASLQRVMTALKLQKPKLASCYEKWLKANRDAQGEVVLSLVVTAQGRVKRAEVGNAGSISAASAECLVTTARSLVLPPLGTEATLEVPLLLRQPGR